MHTPAAEEKSTTKRDMAEAPKRSLCRSKLYHKAYSDQAPTAHGDESFFGSSLRRVDTNFGKLLA